METAPPLVAALFALKLLLWISTREAPSAATAPPSAMAALSAKVLSLMISGKLSMEIAPPEVEAVLLSNLVLEIVMMTVLP